MTQQYPEEYLRVREILNRAATNLDSDVTNIRVALEAGEKVYTKTEVDELISRSQPRIVKFSVVAGAVTYTDFNNIISSFTRSSTGQYSINFVSGFFPRAIGFMCQSNVVAHYDYPLPTSNPLTIITKLVSTGGNFDTNETVIMFWPNYS